jgi:hypothetical protein
VLLPARAAADDACPTESCTQLRVELHAAGQRQAIEEATVVVIQAPPDAREGALRQPPPLPEKPSWQRSASPDARGEVLLEQVPVGLVRVVVIAPGFERHESIVRVGAKPSTKIFVQPDEDSAFRTVVESSASPKRATATSQLLTREEIRTVPGTQGDPLRALQNMPGVARAPGSLGLLVLRGAAPGQSRVFLGGHALPRAFHVLSLASVFPAEVLDELEFIPGNFDSAYGNATGGIVVIEPRRGRRDGFHGYGEIDLAAAGALVEGPLRKGSFIVGAQRGYIDAALAGADAIVEGVSGEPNNFLRPSYYDYQATFDHPVGRDANIGVRVFGAGDRVRASGGSGFDDESRFEFRSDFHRIDFHATKRSDGWTLWWTPSFRFEVNRLEETDDIRRRLRRDYVFSNRAEVRRSVSRNFAVMFGTDLELSGFGARDDVQVSIDAEESVQQTTRASGTEASIGAYTSWQARLGPVTLRPGVRGSAFTADDQTAFSVDPRFVTHIDPHERWRISLGVGRYSQVRSVRESEALDLIGQGAGIGDGSLFLPPVFARFDPEISFAPGNRDLTVRTAMHASAGLRHMFDESWSIEGTGFLREQDNGTPVFFDGTVVELASKERALGLELLVRKRLTRKLYGWIAYTLMWAEVRFVDAPPGVEESRRPSDFDQRHNLVLLASYLLPHRWRVGGRFRVVTGYPYTPVIGSIALQGGQYGAILGQTNSGRLPVFHQLDIRVDKQWYRKRVIFTAYLDVQNVYNRQNPEAVIYGPDFREEVGVVGMPIFPTLGFRIDF